MWPTGCRTSGGDPGLGSVIAWMLGSSSGIYGSGPMSGMAVVVGVDIVGPVVVEAGPSNSG